MADGRMLKKRKHLTKNQRIKIAEKYNCLCQGCGMKGILDYDRGYVLSNHKKYTDWDCTRFIYTPMEFDHIVPLSKGGSNDLSNFQLLCGKCNRKKGNKYDC